MSDHSDTRIKLAKIKKSIHFPGDDEAGLPYLGKEVAGCTSVIKNDTSDLVVDERIQAELVDAELINWCRTIQPLYPTNALGQGNQFLCALSVALWNTSDGASVLRRLLYVFISEFAKDLLHARWIRWRTDTNQTTTDLDFKKFTDMTRGQSERDEVSSSMADPFPLPLHVFAAANVLRRPIVIIGDEEDDFAGLYLPVLWTADDCIQWPLVIARHKGLFYPLLGREVPAAGQKLAEFAVPLVSSNLQPLKIQFLLETEEAEAYLLLQNYLKITDLNMTRSSDICLILSAKLKYIPLDGNEVTQPGSAEITASSTNAELLQQTQRTIGNGVLPSAPSASVLTLNNLSVAEPFREEERDISMLQETCRFPGYNLFASRFTEPFCWEHVEARRQTVPPERLEVTRPTEEPVDVSVVNERCKEARCPNMASRFIYPYCYEHIDRKTVETVIQRRPPQDQLPSGLSVVMERCNHRNCRNYASQYIYPFCYEHIDDREIAGAKPTSSNQPRIHQESEVSMMVEQCIDPNCHNHASKYTFPVCYEHLDSPLAISRAAASTHVIQLPRPVQATRVVNGEHTSRASPNAASQVVEVDKKFEQTMKELEARTKSNVPRCVNDGCTNFGNGRCRGYCHSCYKLLYPI